MKLRTGCGTYTRIREFITGQILSCIFDKIIFYPRQSTLRYRNRVNPGRLLGRHAASYSVHS
jgi:hypothetical protein